MKNNQIKIIPLLVVVAMVSFSVRLVDFAVGVSSLSGSAFAARSENNQSPPLESAAPAPDDAALTLAQNDTPAPPLHDEDTADDLHGATADEAGTGGIEWRDAKDEAVGTADVHQEVLADIVARKQTLDEREKKMAARDALLRAAEQELDQKYRELMQLRAEIEGLLDRQSEEEKERIGSLVKIYEGMKPKDAAVIFDTLDLDVLIAVMGRMSERKLSPILASMNPERARTVTIMLAEEKQLPQLPQN